MSAPAFPRRQQSTKSPSRKQKNRKLLMQSLDKRELMAGDVEFYANLSGGDDRFQIAEVSSPAELRESPNPGDAHAHQTPLGRVGFAQGIDADPSAGVVCSGREKLYAFDTQAETLADLGSIRDVDGNSIEMRSLTVSPQGELFGLHAERSGYTTVGHYLYRIDPEISVATHVGRLHLDAEQLASGDPLPTTNFAYAIEFASDGTLFAAGFRLMTINPDTAQIESQSERFDDYVVELDHGPDGQLRGVLGSSSKVGQVVLIDPVTGAQTLDATYPTEIEGLASRRVGQTDSGDGDRILIGNTGNGIAATDAKRGTGYFVYTQQKVAERFAGAPLHPDNAEHLIAIFRQGDAWYADINEATPRLFIPRSSDVLVAEVDFTADVVNTLQGNSGETFGITRGYTEGDLVFTANRWGDTNNAGEFGVSGTYFSTQDVSDDSGILIGNTGNGIAATDAKRGTGYFVYTQQKVAERFAGAPLHPDNAEHLIAIFRQGDAWYADINEATPRLFTPRSSDVLVAEVDFTADVVSTLQGDSGETFGIKRGYAEGDLVFTANRWGDTNNAGEFGVSGTYFSTQDVSDDSGILIGNTGNGIAATDAKRGTGYFVYTQQKVAERFAGAPLHPDNAEHLIAIFRQGDAWYADINEATPRLFTPRSSDVLLAEVDFTADVVTSLEGESGFTFGIARGYASGNLHFTANRWGATANQGEFGVRGSYFVPHSTTTPPPVANGDTYRIDEDHTLTVSSLDGVFANDSNLTGTAFAELMSGPRSGELSLAHDGSFRYVPDDDFFGQDSFTYRVVDGDLVSQMATAAIQVRAINDAPTNLALSQNRLQENAGAVRVGRLNTTDPDVGDRFTYELLTRGDHQHFSVQGDELWATDSLDYETKNAYSVIVRHNGL